MGFLKVVYDRFPCHFPLPSLDPNPMLRTNLENTRKRIVWEAAGTINKTVLQFFKEGGGEALWWEDGRHIEVLGLFFWPCLSPWLCLFLCFSLFACVWLFNRF